MSCSMTTVELCWPEKQVRDVLDYTYDATPILETDDEIATVSASIKPGGEMLVDDIEVDGNEVTLWLDGGVGGRCYLVRMVISCISNRIFDVLVTLPMSRTLMVYPFVDPVNTDFSEETIWMAPSFQTATATISGEGAMLA